MLNKMLQLKNFIVIPKVFNYKIIVLSKQLIWVPQGSQAETFKNNPIKPVFDKVLIAKLREN